ncbi:uncharacterized protein LOC111185348 isoform X2 [Delphinapterus leucas]|uniref:Uncharacterized protein LOC111185348 isoform X2 n=1 Tax=Delphinapterus leucas TaxID=9749 RepID=A0A2Y9PZK5_DELLE|nr:uncharacterized protein LOC111185348 isoform X2 [Delphinapterus leucas]
MKRGTKERGNVAFCAWCLKGIAEMEEFLKNLAKERMTCKNLPNPESMKQTFNNTSQVDGRWKRAVEEEAFRVRWLTDGPCKEIQDAGCVQSPKSGPEGRTSESSTGPCCICEFVVSVDPQRSSGSESGVSVALQNGNYVGKYETHFFSVFSFF